MFLKGQLFSLRLKLFRTPASGVPAAGGGTRAGGGRTVRRAALLAGLGLVSLLVVSCRGDEAQAPLPTATPTVVPTVRPTPTATPRPTPTAIATVVVRPTPTATPRPTPTPRPTLTPAPTPTSTPRPPPTPTPTPTPTPLPPQPSELLLEVSSPEDSTVVSSDRISVMGRASPDATVSVNGQLAAVDDLGNFETTEPLVLSEGPNLIEVIASDLTGEVQSQVLTVVYIP